MKRFSLRSRLVAGLVIVVLGGLLAADLTTYAFVRDFLVNRVDEQLQTASPLALGRLGRQAETNQEPRAPNPNATSGNGQPGGATPPVGAATNPNPQGTGPNRQGNGGGFRGTPPAFVPPGTYGEFRAVDGTTSNLFFGLDAAAYSPPNIPASIAGFANSSSGAESYFSVDSTDGGFEYRVRAQRLPDGGTVLIAIPLTELNNTLSTLRLTEFGVTVAVLAVVAAMALSLVRLSLRPLDSIADVAADIAGGNMTRRIDHTDSRTEIGRLGAALNQMLASLEEAFAEQQASEEQLRRFLADASHELRTPLTSIRGYAELFRRGANDRPADLDKVLRRVDEESQRMSVLVDELLLLARLRQRRDLERTPVDLSRIASDVVDDARVLSPDRPISLSVDPPVIVEGDDGRLRQVMTNLITNALNHTGSDESVSVTVRGETGQAVIEVADTGTGLSPEDAVHVFEPFYRVDKGRIRSAGGTGLGLAIVKAIVESHGGTVAVRENSPHGAIFQVVLPFQGQKPDPPQDARKPSIEPAASSVASHPGRFGRKLSTKH